MGEWVVSGNEGLTEERVFLFFCLYVRLVYSTGRKKCLIKYLG